MAFPIVNANTVPLSSNPGTLPNMGETIMGWFQNLTFSVITKTIVNMVVQETYTPVSFLGVIEALSPQLLAIKPEGQRQWTWYTVWALPNLVLKPDDIFTYLTVTYRVMKRNDFTQYGYVQYEIVENYQ